MKKLKSYIKKFTVISSITFSMLISTNGICQSDVIKPKTASGFSLNSQVSSDGYGTQFLPTIFLLKGRKTCGIAPTIQKNKFILSGVQINYEYALTGNQVKYNSDCDIELFIFITIAYHNGAVLGKNKEREEKLANKNLVANDISNLKFSSTETYAGFGLKIPFLTKFKWSSSIGFGYFKSINHPGNLYYEGQNIGLQLNTGISMEVKNPFNKNNNYTLNNDL